jgi:putative transposase
MKQLSYRQHRFSPPIIQQAIWLYLPFTLSYRDVEELLTERGLGLSYETVRRWVLKFGPLIAAASTPPATTEKSCGPPPLPNR